MALVVFDKYNYITFGDLSRCPYHPFTWEAQQWFREDDKRLLLRALDEYADVLQDRRIITREEPARMPK